MIAPEGAQADHVRILFNGGLDDLFGELVPQINYFHTGVLQELRHEIDAAPMNIEPQFRHDDPDFSFHSIHLASCWMDVDAFSIMKSGGTTTGRTPAGT